MSDEDKALVERMRAIDYWGMGEEIDEAIARIEALSAQLHTVLDREAETHRRHDAKVEALSVENERLREVLRGVTPPPHFGESEQNKAWWAKARAALGETK